MKIMNLPRTVIALVATAVTSQLAQGAGRTINWNSDVNSTFLQQDGTTGIDGSFTFAFGTFTVGFTPTDDNFDLWAANFRSVGTATAANGGFSQLYDYYSGSFNVLNNTAPFEAGNQSYLWLYNSQAIDTNSQWLLLTDDSGDGNANDNWIIPAAPFDQTTLPLEWVLRDNNTPNSYTVVWGGATGGQAGDPGIFTAPTGPFTLQAHALPVPEPTSVALLSAGLLAMGRRRKS